MRIRERGSFGLMLLAVILCLPECGFVVARIFKEITFDISVTDRLKRAADANTVELAKQELTVVTKRLKDNGLTSGYTSLLYRTPDEDVGFWYSNLEAALQELNKVTPETTQLERSNMLMKLRETLLDHGSGGDHVTKPDGITVFPNNAGYAAWGLLSLVFLIISIFLFAAAID